MIAGFNTDIKHDGVVYHVQTEDKGLSSALIVSLVYNKGTIIASRRTSYTDIVGTDVDKDKLSERLTRQHRLICAAIKAGRIEELKNATPKTAKYTAPARNEAADKPIEPPAEHLPLPRPQTFGPTSSATRGTGPITIGRIETKRVISVIPNDPPEMPKSVVSPPDDPFADGPVIEDVQIIEEEFVLEPEAVSVVSELSGFDRPANQKLGIELLGNAKFVGGEKRSISVMVCRGTGRKVISDAQVMIKVLGSSFRPVIFHAKTDANGLATVHLQLPRFSAGRAALLIRAMVDGEEAELRKIVSPA
ncbi:MAG: hypothetical protein IT172_12180 [Acidobacteria bacterium]|nr:hypothetical protein [Acidobacteriota bacterium]